MNDEQENLQQEQTGLEKLKNLVSQLKIWQVALIFVFVIGITIAGGYFLGYNQKIDNDVTKQLVLDAQKQDTEYQKTKEELQSLKKEVDAQQETIKFINDFNENKKNLEKEVSDTQTKLDQLKTDLNSINEQITAKTAELNKLQGDILVAKDNPITLPAGMFTIGKDIPAGRYRVSGSSNFFAYNTRGSLIVNTILGNGYFASGDYICDLQDGYTVKNAAKTTFTPLQE